MPNSTGSKASACSHAEEWRTSRPHSTTRFGWPASSRLNHSSFARRRASPGCGASKAGGRKRGICSPRSTAGSPRASTPPTSRMPQNSSPSWREAELVMDIAEWLRGLGLEQYEKAFRENAIDVEVLRDLTADDIKELGVTPIGHRRRLLT